jgi:hypothetical protein
MRPWCLPSECYSVRAVGGFGETPRVLAFGLALSLRAGSPPQPRVFYINGKPYRLVIKSWREVYHLYRPAEVSNEI